MDRISQNQIDQWNARASQALGSGDYREAISIYGKVLALFPDDIAALNNQGLALLETGQYEAAMANFQHSIALHPDIAQLHYNMGRCLHKQGQSERAIPYYQKAISLEPVYREALQNLGAALKRVGRVKEAAHCYGKLLDLNPNDANARYMLDALSGTDRHKKAPREFVTGVFDDYAGHFEDQLVKTLDYHVPAQLRQALASFLGEPTKFEALLDLGCGTGLGGEAFCDFASSMTGVDLSVKMLEKAREKGVYTRLFQADIREFLSQGEGRYDLVVAADVLIYLGMLEDLFPLVAGAMVKGGFFLFSTEDNPDIRGFSLLSSGRYGHGPLYVQSEAVRNGFVTRTCQPAGIRKEGGRWLSGNLYILQWMGEK